MRLCEACHMQKNYLAPKDAKVCLSKQVQLAPCLSAGKGGYILADVMFHTNSVVKLSVCILRSSSRNCSDSLSICLRRGFTSMVATVLISVRE